MTLRKSHLTFQILRQMNPCFCIFDVVAKYMFHEVKIEKKYIPLFSEKGFFFHRMLLRTSYIQRDSVDQMIFKICCIIFLNQLIIG